MKWIIRAVALGIIAVTVPAKADSGSGLLEERYKAALNEMVREVRQAPDAAAKREILGHFLDHMTQGLGKAVKMESIAEEDRSSLHAVLEKYDAYGQELKGEAGFEPVADADLDGFAGYIQQGMDQAPMGGGVYISGGALVVILLLLIVLF